jgi:WD40 repeat protein
MSPTPWSTYSAGANFSPDGSKLILCGRFDRGWDRDNITVWDVRSGRRLVNWTRDGGRIGSVSLAPDGRSLLAGDRSGKLSLIEIASDRERTSFRHGSEVISADFHPDGTKIVASSSEAPVYVWDLMGDAPKWDATKADSIWSDLASMDAKKAFAAIRTLRANPVEAIAFLKERLKPAESPADAKLAAMLKQLDSPKFAERELAQKELTLIADLIQSKLQAARKTSSEEALVRIDAILKTIDDPTPDRLRSARACEVLEGVGSTDAIAVLRLWSSGVVGSKLTTEAQESVIRLKNR